MPAEKMRDRAIPQAPSVATRAVLYFVFGFLAFVGVSMVAMHVYLRSAVPGPLIAPTRQFPQPRLEVTPERDFARFEREQKKVLSGYGWVDQGRGLIHIPIDDAMRIVAGRGARAYDGTDQPAVSPQPAASSGNQP